MSSTEKNRPWELRKSDFTEAFPRTVASYLQLPSTLISPRTKALADEKRTIHNLLVKTSFDLRRNVVLHALHVNPVWARVQATTTLNSLAQHVIQTPGDHDTEAMQIILLGDLGTIHRELANESRVYQSDDKRCLVHQILAVDAYMHADLMSEAMTDRAFEILYLLNDARQSRVATAISNVYYNTPGSRLAFGTPDKAMEVTNTLQLPAPGYFMW